MKDYKDFPPIRYFERVLKACPKSTWLYTQLWKNKTSKTILKQPRKSIYKDYLISPTLFRNLIIPLIYLHVITCDEYDHEFHIGFSGPDIDE